MKNLLLKMLNTNLTFHNLSSYNGQAFHSMLSVAITKILNIKNYVQQDRQFTKMIIYGLENIN